MCAPAVLAKSKAGPALAAILALAFALRAYLALAHPAIAHPDEIYQITEQAHRLVFGYGVEPWEFRIGARNWLLPGLTAGWLALASLVGISGTGTLTGLSLGLGLLSLVSVWAAWRMGRRISRLHAITAALAAATWVELAYYGLHPLGEAVATNSLLLAIALLPPEESRASTRFWGGVALGLSFILRFHLAPALALIAIVSGGRDWRRRWLPMLAGAALPIFGLGLLDWVSWGVPFGSILTNFSVNVVADRASSYGTLPAWYFIFALEQSWGPAIVPAFALIAMGATRKPILLWVALVIIASHSLIAHKEYRFIVPAIACLVVLMGLGVGELILSIRKRRWAPLALLLIPALSLAASLTGDTQKRLTAGRNWLSAFSMLKDDTALCGLGFVGKHWVDMPGYSALARPIPIYFWDQLIATGHAGAANIVISDRQGPGDPAYTAKSCVEETKGIWPAVCIYRRSGACAAMPDLAINPELVRRDQ